MSPEVASIPGIHHITAMAGAPQRNVDFYGHVLGQRLVKTTVNFDDPGTYHLYYGDSTGSPGTIMTFFPWPTARRGRAGTGEVGAVAYSVAPHSLPFWAERLRSYGVASDQETERFGQPVLPFMDPDGMPVELVATDDALPVKDWAGNPVPADHTLRGFHGATLAVAAAQPSADLLTEHFGFRHVATEGRRYRYVAPGSETGRYLDLLELPGQPRGQLGTGSVHHIAFRVPDDAAQAHWLNRLNSAGYRVTDVQDRQYFRSIYFREPGGVLFEIATDPPGFLADESEAQLGCALRLPPWLEPQRRDIERILPRLDRPGVTAL